MSFFPRRLELYLNVIDEDNAFPEIRVWSKPSYTTVTMATCSNDDPHAAHRYLLEGELRCFVFFTNTVPTSLLFSGSNAFFSLRDPATYIYPIVFLISYPTSKFLTFSLPVLSAKFES